MTNELQTLREENARLKLELQKRVSISATTCKECMHWGKTYCSPEETRLGVVGDCPSWCLNMKGK